MDKKQCNYCGSKYLIISKFYDGRLNPIKKYRCVTCMTCKACGPLAEDDNEAILKWNSRIQEVPEMPRETLPFFKPTASVNMQCPIRNGACNGANCMMWIWVGNDKGRCGLVNTMYINLTGCSTV